MLYSNTSLSNSHEALIRAPVVPKRKLRQSSIVKKIAASFGAGMCIAVTVTQPAVANNIATHDTSSQIVRTWFEMPNGGITVQQVYFPSAGFYQCALSETNERGVEFAVITTGPSLPGFAIHVTSATRNIAFTPGWVGIQVDSLAPWRASAHSPTNLPGQGLVISGNDRASGMRFLNELTGGNVIAFEIGGIGSQQFSLDGSSQAVRALAQCGDAIDPLQPKPAPVTPVAPARPAPKYL